EKDQGMLHAPFGIVGLETVFPLLYTHLVQTEKMTLQQLVNAFTNHHASTFDLPYGMLQAGEPAEITLIDINKIAVINTENFYSKGKNTPFTGWDVKGIPVMTIVDGNIVYEDVAND